MKLTNDLKQKLQYAASVHPSLYVRQGDIIRARSQNRACLVKMKIDQNIPAEFMIYDVNNFLKASALLQDADINFFGDIEDGYMEIANESATIRYGYSAPELYQNAPDDKDFVPPQVEWSLQVKIDESELDNISKVSSVMGLDVVCFTETGIQMRNSKIDSTRIPFEIKYNNKFDNTENVPSEFNVRFSTENFNLYKGSYTMTLIKMPRVFAAKFEHESGDVTVWLSALPSSVG